MDAIDDLLGERINNQRKQQHCLNHAAAEPFVSVAHCFGKFCWSDGLEVIGVHVHAGHGHHMGRQHMVLQVGKAAGPLHGGDHGSSGNENFVGSWRWQQFSGVGQWHWHSRCSDHWALGAAGVCRIGTVVRALGRERPQRAPPAFVVLLV